MAPTHNHSASEFLMEEAAAVADRMSDEDDCTGSPENSTGGGLNGTYMDEESDERYDGPEWFVIPIVFGVIFLVGVIGNGTLIFTVLRNKNMRSTPNVLLVSLALGDLLLILISVPFNSTIYTFAEWPYGERICKLNEFLATLSLGVSVFTLTALSGERYMVIVYPMTSHRGPSTMRTVMIACAIWIVSIGLALMDLIGTSVQNKMCVVCPAEWGETYERFHSMFQFIVYFALPMIIIATFYALMARMLMISSKHLPGDGVKGQAVKQIEARKKVARLVLSFVIVFVICWLPRHIYFLWFYFDPGLYNMFWHVFKIVGFCLCFINSCVNPLALYFLSKQFRRYYNRYMFCCCSHFWRDDLSLAGGAGPVGGCGGGAGGGTNLSMMHHQTPGGKGSCDLGFSQARASTTRSTLQCSIAGGRGVARGGGGGGGGGGGAMRGGRGGRRKLSTTVLTTNSVC